MKCFILYSGDFSRYSKISYFIEVSNEKNQKKYFLSKSPENEV